MNQKTTKRALLASVMSLMLSLAMLIGATFAWFTDTASTAVNKIQSGTLKLSLQYAKEYNTDGTVKTWDDAEGGTLSFLRTDGTKLLADANILWEPGATYKLPQLKISNEGSLALKYKIVISGATGDTDLLSQIDFTSKVNGGQAATFTDGATLVTDKQLLPKEGTTVHSDTIDIEGTMKTTADNKYQNKTITGIAITVVATQSTYEKDSISDQYDKDAEYPLLVSDIKKQYGSNGLRMPAGVAIDNNTDGTFEITLNDEEAFLYFTQVFDRETAFEARKAAWDAGEITKYPYEYNLSSLNMWYGPYCSRITVKMNCDIDLCNRSVKPFGLSGYEFRFDGNGHKIKNAKIAGSSGQVGFFVSRVNVKNLTFENIQISAVGADSAGVVAGSPNAMIDSVAVKNCSVTGAKYTGAIAGYDYGDITNCTVEDTTVCGQYKVGGIVGYVCTDNASQQRNITGNTLTKVTVKGENIWPGKENNGFVIGKIVGNWNAQNGSCINNTFSGTTSAEKNIGEIESGCNVNQ